MFGRARALIAKGDRLANKADWTLEFAQALLDDIQDGVGITIHVDDNAARWLITHLFKGQGGDLTLTIGIDPTWDTIPGKVAEFKGGSHDGKRYTVTEGTTQMVLAPDNEVYIWTGHVFQYQE